MNTQIEKSSIQHDRVKTLRESKGYTIKGLADILGVKYQSIQSIEKPNGVKQPSYISELARTLGVTVDYLLGKEDKVTPRTFTFEELDYKVPSEFKTDFNATHDIESGQQNSLTVDYKWIKNILFKTLSESMKIITVKGSSMEPSFAENDVLLVDTEDCELTDNIFVYKDYKNVHISRLQSKQGKIFGVYDNKHISDTELSKDYQIYGRVIYLWQRRNPIQQILS